MTIDIKNLTVLFDNDQKKVLDNFSMKLDEGQVAIIFGPNGAGKSTLLSVISGLIKAKSGEVIYQGKNILGLSPKERHDLGIAYSFQNPPEIKGLKLKDLLKICLKQKREYIFSEDEMKLIKDFDMERFLERDVNHNFSGGEKKRAEILQLLLMKPKLLLLDEPDSGVDVDSLNLIATNISDYIKKNNASALLISHHGDMFNYIKPDKAFVLMDGQVGCCGKPEEVFSTISKNGYSACVGCNIWE